MKVFLMHRDLNFDPMAPLLPNERALTRDLELTTLLQAMSDGDKFLSDIATKALLPRLGNDQDTISYRQEIMKDCLKNSVAVRELYGVAFEAVEGRKAPYLGFFSKHPSSILYNSIEALEFFVVQMKRLRNMADSYASGFESQGFTAIFKMLCEELSDEYFARVENHLKTLQFKKGVLISAGLGEGLEGVAHVLRRPALKGVNWLDKIFGTRSPAYTFHLDERDEAGARFLSEIRDRGINLVANALAQSVDHIQSFFERLRAELAFYLCGLNLHDKLKSFGAPTCFPQPEALGSRVFRADGLYDICLAIKMGRNIVGNHLRADGKSLVIITGANQGGKSSFLRGVGLAQLMMQSGLFVAGDYFAAELCTGVFTHYRREEDATMEKGKFDEELSRVNDIVKDIEPNSILLFNESFASTNEREGSEITSQITRALLERRIKVFFVTHLYEFARAFFERPSEQTVFLRAERQEDGARTFKLLPGEPLKTSYGEDLYEKIFEARGSSS